jgi:3',5'-cyclic AMP phosphodiesterase CpdA
MVSIPTDNQKRLTYSNKGHGSSARGGKIVLAHLSDPHITGVGPVRKKDLLNKRLIGCLWWKLFRNTRFREDMLPILRKSLKAHEPDHIIVTGDLVHLGLPAEFKKARAWLETLGLPEQVTIVPGNHDAYVRSDWNQTFAGWMDYMVSDPPFRQRDFKCGFNGLYPTLRVRDRIALIGVCSAGPNAPYLATGTLGELQLKKLAAVLEKTAAEGFFRILLIHHPPLDGIVSRRRQLTDAHSLCRVVDQCGVELILHGHVHEDVDTMMNTRSGAIPVLGASSVISSSSVHKRRARYYIHTITNTENVWNIHIARHVYCPDTQRYIPERQHCFQLEDRRVRCFRVSANRTF